MAVSRGGAQGGGVGMKEERLCQGMKAGTGGGFAGVL